jgi:hypothetical protein
LVPLASQLRALDQQVRLCVPPDFQVWIESLGFPVTPIGPELRKTTASSPSGYAGRIVARAANPPASRHSSIFLNAPFSRRLGAWR